MRRRPSSRPTPSAHGAGRGALRKWSAALHRTVWSNIESGEGYCDILLEVPENRVGVVIEMKYAQEDRMEAACTEALKQIEQRQYAARLKSDGMKNIVNYGIACYRKHCKVKIGKENS